MSSDEMSVPGTPTASTQVQGASDGSDVVGPYQRSDEDLVKQIREWWTEASKAKSPIAKKRKRDREFLAGGDGQWERADIDIFKRQKRPRLTINLLRGIVAAVEGEERTNRQEIKFFGETDAFDGAATGLNVILKWIMNHCGGQFALSRMFRHMISVGEGWICPEVDYFDDPEGKIKLVVVRDNEILDDPLSRDPVSSDSRYMIRLKMMTIEEMDARWPGVRDKLQERCQAYAVGPESDGKGYRDIYSTPSDTTTPKIYDGAKKTWAVLETWWYQIEPGWIVVDEASGALVEKTDPEMEVMQSQRQEEQKTWLTAATTGRLNLLAPPAPPAGVPAAAPDPNNPGAPPIPPMPTPQFPKALDAKRRPIKRIYQAFTCYDELLGKNASVLPGLKRFPYVPVRGTQDDETGEWVGLLRDLLDPQIQHNIEQSVMVQLMQLMPKNAWMAPKGAFHNKNDWETKSALPGAMLEYNPSRGKPEQIQPPAIPRHLIELAMTRPQTIREISGVNVEMQGIRQGSDPGVVLEQRSKAAKTVQAGLFDNYRMSKIELGLVLLAYIQAFVPIGRRFRIMGPGNMAQYVQMTGDMKLGQYGLTVEETDASINDRIATLNILQTTLPAMMKAGMSATPEFIDLMPMPPHVRDAWKRQVSWDLAIAGRLPPPNWKPGDPVPMPPPAPGAAPGPGAPPPNQPAPPPAAAPAQ